MQECQGVYLICLNADACMAIVMAMYRIHIYTVCTYTQYTHGGNGVMEMACTLAHTLSKVPLLVMETPRTGWLWAHPHLIK